MLWGGGGGGNLPYIRHIGLLFYLGFEPLTLLAPVELATAQKTDEVECLFISASPLTKIMKFSESHISFHLFLWQGLVLPYGS